MFGTQWVTGTIRATLIASNLVRFSWASLLCLWVTSVDNRSLDTTECSICSLVHQSALSVQFPTCRGYNANSGCSLTDCFFKGLTFILHRIGCKTGMSALHSPQFLYQQALSERHCVQEFLFSMLSLQLRNNYGCWWTSMSFVSSTYSSSWAVSKTPHTTLLCRNANTWSHHELFSGSHSSKLAILQPRLGNSVSLAFHINCYFYPPDWCHDRLVARAAAGQCLKTTDDYTRFKNKIPAPQEISSMPALVAAGADWFRANIYAGIYLGPDTHSTWPELAMECAIAATFHSVIIDKHNEFQVWLLTLKWVCLLTLKLRVSDWSWPWVMAHDSLIYIDAPIATRPTYT